MAVEETGKAAGAVLDIKDNSEQKQLLPSKQVQVIDPVNAVSSLGECKEKDPAEQRITLKVSRRRWIVLAVVALLNNLNTMIWIAFSPISNHVDTFYGSGAAIWFAGIYIVVTIPVGIFAMWAGGYFGLRSSILIATWANCIGAFVRLASSLFPSDLAHFRFHIGITGQAIAAFAYPFIMFLPTKVAAAWFPENQRTLATTIGVMSNPLGVLVANLLSPILVNNCEQVHMMNILFAVPAILLTLLASMTILRSEPKVPPSLSASKPSYPFIEGIKKCFTNTQYLALLLVLGGGIGMFNTLYALMQQLLCPSGYRNQFSGFTSALLITGGVVGATGASFIVDRTKMYVQTMKISMTLAVTFGLIFLQLVLHREMGIWILLACFVFGVFGLAAYPVGLQLSAECTYPVSETTSTALVVISGQIQSILYMAVMAKFASPLQQEYRNFEVCSVAKATEQENPPKCGYGSIIEETVEPKDFTTSVILMSVIASLIVVVLLFLFRPKLRRMEMEHGLLSVETAMTDTKKPLKEGEEQTNEKQTATPNPQQSAEINDVQLGGVVKE